MPTTSLPSSSQLARALEISQQLESLESELQSILQGVGSAPAAAATYTPRAAAPSVFSAPAVKSGRGGKRTISAASRQKMAEAQRRRWAKSSGSSAPAAAKSAPAAKSGRKGLTPEGRARLAAAMAARWAAAKRTGKAPNASRR